jgi:hypothetical protein
MHEGKYFRTQISERYGSTTRCELAAQGRLANLGAAGADAYWMDMTVSHLFFKD